MKGTRIVRISNQLAKQIEDAAKKNKKTIVEASEEISRIIKVKKPRKIIREEIFEF